MNAWAAFGFGFLFGATVMDLAWRRLRKLEERLRERIAASVDTHAERGDSTEIEAPSLMGSAVGAAETHNLTPIPKDRHDPINRVR